VIAFLFSKIFPPKRGKMTREEVENSMRLHAIEVGLLKVYQAEPKESGVLNVREWTNGRWRNRRGPKFRADKIFLGF